MVLLLPFNENSFVELLFSELDTNTEEIRNDEFFKTVVLVEVNGNKGTILLFNLNISKKKKKEKKIQDFLIYHHYLNFFFRSYRLLVMIIVMGFQIWRSIVM